MEDRASRGRNLMAAPSAGELFASSDPVKTVGLAAFAGAAVRKPLVKQVLQAGGIVRELFVELLNRIFHFHASSLTNVVGQPLSKLKEKIGSLG